MLDSFDSDRPPSRLQSDEFKDVLGEIAAVIAQQFPDIRRELATGRPVKDAADRVFVDLKKPEGEQSEWTLSVEILIDVDVQETPKRYSVNSQEMLEKESLTREGVAKMLRHMSNDSRQFLAECLMEGVEEDLRAALEFSGKFEEIPALIENMQRLRSFIAGAEEDAEKIRT